MKSLRIIQIKLNNCENSIDWMNRLLASADTVFTPVKSCLISIAIAAQISVLLAIDLIINVMLGIFC